MGNYDVPQRHKWLHPVNGVRLTLLNVYIILSTCCSVVNAFPTTNSENKLFINFEENQRDFMAHRGNSNNNNGAGLTVRPVSIEDFFF